MAGPDFAHILQLGSPSGYEPLRRYLLDGARAEGLAGPGDDLIVTNGCQQALDLIGRVLLRPGDKVVVEDPVYPGLKSLFLEAGTQLIGVPVGADGVEIDALESALERERPRLMVVTSNFQNPTGATLPSATYSVIVSNALGAVSADATLTVFPVSASGTSMLSLYWFTGGADGYNPYGALVQGTDGNFYGTTVTGGANKIGGTVYRITPAGTLTQGSPSSEQKGVAERAWYSSARA